ncbi:Nucleoporin [Lachnellula hyalina]|uniref:Nucleoporin n=1 Tax=Lachnellula hyalina TaxID=1316788 RepID=A0A8H8R3K6_9HELO|nr:Nucleoporin [Lachnellula hyalina]TVY27021.1 Nucleoporin [Lachnellula hyalina]
MPPLILHNVPDEELYVGDDGIQRPYAMLFPGNESNPISRTRRSAAETGSFGKSTRRSRSRTGTPAAKREDPTLAAADAIFAGFLASKAAEPENTQRKSSLSASVSQPNLSTSVALAPTDGNAQTPKRFVHKEPTEVILRGFKSTHQYAAIRDYERIGGRICEDYPRDPPLEQRRYKSDLRDQAALRTQPMTAEEKAKALRFAGGEHWIKITFESADGAEAAVDASPQNILGHLVYAELYRGVPPTADEEISSTGAKRTPRSLGVSSGQDSIFGAKRSSTLPRSYTTPAMAQIPRGVASSISPPGSNTSSNTLDTATLSAGGTTTSSATLIGTQAPPPNNEYCQRIPTAKRAKLLPAEQALLPQKSLTQQVLSQIPFLSLLSGDMIGSQVPRDEQGKFDWKAASMYWKFFYWLDSWTGLFDLVDGTKED